MRDVQRIQQLLRENMKQDTLPGFDKLIFYVQKVKDEFLDAKLLLGRKAESSYFCYARIDNGALVLEYIQELREHGKNTLTKVNLKNMEFSSPLSEIVCAERKRFNALPNFIRAAFIMKGYTRDNPVELSAKCQSYIIKAAKAIESEGHHSTPSPLLDSSDEAAEEPRVLHSRSTSPQTRAPKLYGLGQNPGINKTTAPSPTKGRGMFNGAALPKQRDTHRRKSFSSQARASMRSATESSESSAKTMNSPRMLAKNAKRKRNTKPGSYDSRVVLLSDDDDEDEDEDETNDDSFSRNSDAGADMISLSRPEVSATNITVECETTQPAHERPIQAAEYPAPGRQSPTTGEIGQLQAEQSTSQSGSPFAPMHNSHVARYLELHHQEAEFQTELKQAQKDEDEAKRQLDTLVLQLDAQRKIHAGCKRKREEADTRNLKRQDNMKDLLANMSGAEGLEVGRRLYGNS